jgi:NADH-quinone oxidoreductase subunit L
LKEFWGKAFAAASHKIIDESHHVPGWVPLAPFIAMLVGFGLSYVYYIQSPWLPAATAKAFRPVYLFLLNKWYFDELYDRIFVRPAFAIGRALWRGGDMGAIDGLIDGTANRVIDVTNRAVRLQTGYVYHYAFAMLIGVALILSFLMFSGGAMR